MIEPNEKYRRLQKKILRLGLAIPGTIRKVYLKCGKENCCCMAGKESIRHGPYFLWDRKVNGRLSSLSIAESDLSHYEKCIANRKELEELIAEILEVGTHLAVQFKKNTSSTRGK
jgi:hypothetical protein